MQASNIGTVPTDVADTDAQRRTGGSELPPSSSASQQQAAPTASGPTQRVCGARTVHGAARAASSNIQRDATPKGGGQANPVTAMLPRAPTDRQCAATAKRGPWPIALVDVALNLYTATCRPKPSQAEIPQINNYPSIFVQGPTEGPRRPREGGRPNGRDTPQGRQPPPRHEEGEAPSSYETSTTAKVASG